MKMVLIQKQNYKTDEKPSIAARFVLSEGYSSDDNSATLCCPVCGFDYVHLGSVEILQNRTKSFTTYDKTEVTAHDRQQPNEGSRVVINFWCENHHKITYSFAFHKGNTAVTLAVGEAPPNEMLWSPLG